MPERPYPLVVILCLALAGLLPPAHAADDQGSRRAVDRALDALHTAASNADEKGYFALFAPEAVFLGTDATERWNIQEFRAYVHPYFSRGEGWTYEVEKRNIDFTPDGAVAWFDELLQNERYGECRGTGLLRRVDGVWRIVQYNLTIPVPNGVARDVVERIRKGPSEED